MSGWSTSRSSSSTAVFLLAVVVLKIKTEEAFLGERFGSAYRRYQEEVKALIPFVY
jgi:protein-S-isoprenylcysteine O-methyltransferase Ste14